MKSNYLIYVDFNALYLTIMSHFKLPMVDFQELSDQELLKFQRQDITHIDVIAD